MAGTLAVNRVPKSDSDIDHFDDQKWLGSSKANNLVHQKCDIAKENKPTSTILYRAIPYRSPRILLFRIFGYKSF